MPAATGGFVGTAAGVAGVERVAGEDAERFGGRPVEAFGGKAAPATDWGCGCGGRGPVSRPTNSVSSTPSATSATAGKSQPSETRRRRGTRWGIRSRLPCSCSARAGCSLTTGTAARVPIGVARGKSGSSSRAARPSSGSTRASSGLMGPSSGASDAGWVTRGCSLRSETTMPPSLSRLPSPESISADGRTGTLPPIADIQLRSPKCAGSLRCFWLDLKPLVNRPLPSRPTP